MGREQSSSFGLLLKRHRRSAGLTQEELAEQAGLSVRAISDIERSVRHPRRDTAELLLDALELSVDDRARLEILARGPIDTPSGRDRSEPLLETGGYLGSLPEGGLIGRERELGRILALVSAVMEGRGRLVMVVGEPGIGKTRLAQEIALEARERGFLVATGRCYEQEQGVPFHPFLEALPIAYAAAPSAVQDDTPHRWPSLVRLLSPLKIEFPNPGSNGQEEQHRFFREVSGFVRAVAAEIPVALLLDDLHWADSASLKLFLHLARHSRSHRVLLLSTYRDIEVNRHHPMERALVDLNRERLMERVVLRRPDKQDTAALIAATIGEVEGLDELTALIHRATDGNPFFVQEVLRALEERGDIYGRHGRWTLRDVQQVRVPESVHSAIGERLSRLRPEAQAVLGEASVLGETFTFDDLWSVSQRREEEIEQALEEAVRAGLIRETERDDYSFVHALTQQTLYGDLPARRRRRIHLAVGESLERLPERIREQRVAELAWHFHAGDDAERALRYAMLAGDRALDAFGYGEAERYYRTVLELAPRLEAAAQKDASPRRASTAEAEAHAKLGRVLNITERYDDGLTALDQAAQLFRRLGDVEREAAMVTEIGWVHSALGTAEEGIARIQPLVVSLEEANDPSTQSLGGLYTALARLYFSLGQYQKELEAAERAAELGRGSDVMLATAEARRGAALINLRRRQEARLVLERAVALASTCGSLGTMSQALEYLGEICRDTGDFHRSREYYEQSRQIAEQTHVPSRVAWTTCKVGYILFLLGDWQRAHTHFERAAEMYAAMGAPEGARRWPPLSEQLLLAEGRWDQAEQSLEAIIAEAHPKRDIWILRYAHLTLAERDLLASRSEAALSRLEPLLGSGALEEPVVVRLLPNLAQAYVQQGDEHRAEEVLEIGMARAEAEPHMVASMAVLRIRGMLRTRQGRWEEARHDFEESIARARRCPYPYDEARSLFELGMMNGGAGELQQARKRFQEALVIFEGLGARPYIERTRRALKELEAT